VDGLTAGRQIAEYVVNGFLRPISKPAHLAIKHDGTAAVTGTAGNKYVVENSHDLLRWAPLLTNAAPFTFTAPVGRAMEFYRAVAAE